MQALITKGEINNLARECNADSELLQHCIIEAQELDIKPTIGDALYLQLDMNTERIQTLMNGGEYTDKRGNLRTFNGIKTALAYYAYARAVRASNGVQTRYGFVQKQDDYSTATDMKARTMAYDETFAIADSYMREVVEYLKCNLDTYTEAKEKLYVRNNRIKYRMIGD